MLCNLVHFVVHFTKNLFKNIKFSCTSISPLENIEKNAIYPIY